MMDTTPADSSASYQPPHFQTLLFTFLDTQAPELSMKANLNKNICLQYFNKALLCK